MKKSLRVFEIVFILAILLIVSTGGAFAIEIIDDGEVTNQYTPLYIGTWLAHFSVLKIAYLTHFLLHRAPQVLPRTPFH